MGDFFRVWFPHIAAPPNGNVGCVHSEPLFWSLFLSDVLIFAAYISIPAIYVWVTRRLASGRARAILIPSAAFVLACGLDHLAGAVMMVWPALGLHAATKAVTAIISVYVAGSLAHFVMSYRRRENLTGESPDMDLESALSHLAYGECLLAYSPLPGGIFGLDEEHTPRIKFCNPAFADALGYTPEELKGAQFLEMLHPDDVQATVAIWEGSAVPIIDAGKGSNVEGSLGLRNRYKRKDGGWACFRWLDIPDPVISEHGSIAAFCELLEITK